MNVYIYECIYIYMNVYLSLLEQMVYCCNEVRPPFRWKKEQNKALYDDEAVYLECYSGKGFHMNYSVCMSYVKHINSSNKA
jgi:hypothetical protein